MFVPYLAVQPAKSENFLSSCQTSEMPERRNNFINELLPRLRSGKIIKVGGLKNVVMC